MNVTMLIPGATLPPEGRDFLSSSGKTGGELVSIFRRLGSCLDPLGAEKSSDLSLLRPSNTDDSGFEVFPVSIRNDGGFESMDAFGAALQSWLAPMNLAAVGCGRVSGADSVPVFAGNGEVAVETRVCTGRPGKGTPTGTFKIGEKVRSGKIPTIYRVALPNWMRLTNNGIGLHVGEILDTPSSADCIRLPAGIAATIFDHLPRDT